MKIFAKIITYITFPGIWAVLGVYFLSRIDISNVIEIQAISKSNLLTGALVFYIVLPMLFVYFMVYKKRFESIQLSHVKERKIAVPFALLSALIFVYFTREIMLSKQNLLAYSKMLDFHPLLEWEQLVVMSLMIQTLFIFLNFKISIHMLSMTAFLTFTYQQFNHIKSSIQNDCLVGENLYHWPQYLLQPNTMNIILLTLCAMAILVFISRKVLNAHNYQELIIGSIVGISITFVNSILFYSIWN